MARKTNNQFDLSEIMKLDSGSVNEISKPKLIDFYENNYGRILPAKGIQYFIMPKRSDYPIDLNKGHEEYIAAKVQQKDNGCDFFALKYAQKQNGAAAENVDMTNIYSRASTLALIMRTPYISPFEKHINWVICASRYEGNIYIYLLQNKIHDDGLSKTFSHHYIFNQILFSSSPKETPIFNEPYNENKHLIGMFNKKISNYNLIYSTEILGIQSEEEIQDFDDLSKLGESRFVLTKQVWAKMRNKDRQFFKYWLQCHLAGVDDLYVGEKNDDGIITEPVKHVYVPEIPKYQKWKPKTCSGFLHQFLQLVEKTMKNVNSLDTVYEFSYDPEGRKMRYEIFENNKEHSFIDEEFKEFMKAKNS